AQCRRFMGVVHFLLRRTRSLSCPIKRSRGSGFSRVLITDWISVVSGVVFAAVSWAWASAQQSPNNRQQKTTNGWRLIMVWVGNRLSKANERLLRA
ncbi:MAG: hypothetical protein WAW41_00360, partial [Methylobacter sp.]